MCVTSGSVAMFINCTPIAGSLPVTSSIDLRTSAMPYSFPPMPNCAFISVMICAHCCEATTAGLDIASPHNVASQRRCHAALHRIVDIQELPRGNRAELAALLVDVGVT